MRRQVEGSASTRVDVVAGARIVRIEMLLLTMKSCSKGHCGSCADTTNSCSLNVHEHEGRRRANYCRLVVVRGWR